MTSCSPTKKLAGSKLLIKNRVNIETKSKIENKAKLKRDILSLTIQQPNGTFLFIPKEYLWEAPVAHNPQIAQKTVTNIQNYLKNKAGYYHAKVTLDSLSDGRNIELIYNIDPKDRYHVGEIMYYGPDTIIVEEINSLKEEALLRTGDPIDAGLFDLELSRITLALQNKGYANFAANYIKIKGDSSTVDRTVDIFFEVLPPQSGKTHTKYTIGDINVFTDYRREQKVKGLTYEIFDNKSYMRESSDFIINPGSINNMVFLEKGETYTRDNRSKTFRKLSGLGTYKFVTISPNIDSLQEDILNYNIFLTPQKHSWIADFGSELFYSTVNQNNRQLFGINLSTQFQNRNFFGGGEQFTIGTETGSELQLDPLFQASTVNLSLNSNLEIPKQVDLFNLARVLTGIGILPKNEYQRFREETVTNIGLGTSFVNILNNYSITSVSADFAYDYRRSKNTRYLITTLGVDMNLYNLDPRFVDIYGENQFLLNSFENNFITGFLFKDITYIHSTPENQRGLSKTLILSFEASGWEKSILNSLYNAISGSDSDWKVGDISFSRFLRLEADRRWYQKFGNSTLAFRVLGGIIVPFGSDISAPFVKQFSVGGPNSLRAWDQRELGPGGYAEALEKPVINQTFFQQGDVKLEFNIEYRFPIIWLLEGALFLDGGNVWTLSNDVERPGSQISGDFYKQIALGFGYGLRWDFDYFNIRFDFGYKLKRPYHEDIVKEIKKPYFDNPDINGYWYTWRGIKNQGFGNFQVAVNYPF